MHYIECSVMTQNESATDAPSTAAIDEVEVFELADGTLLSEQEARVHVCKQRGLSHGDIAVELGIDRSTVDEYSRRIGRKLEQARDDIRTGEATLERVGEPHDAVRTIAVDVDALRETYRRNQRDDARGGRDVLRLSPPFAPELEASVHYSEDGTYYPPEMDPKPIHVAPRQFVAEDKLPVLREGWALRSFVADEEGYDDPAAVPDDVVAEYAEVEEEVWADQFRRALVDEVDLFGRAPSHRPHTVHVEYREGDA
jgi:hypothetical protein